MDDTPIAEMSDANVLALVELMLPEDQQEELSELLNDQSESRITDAGKIRLDELMQIYGEGMLRKAKALAVAVERGLLPRGPY